MTAVSGDGLDGGYKSAVLQFVSFERREDTSDCTNNLNCTASTSAVTSCVTGFVVLVR